MKRMEKKIQHSTTETFPFRSLRTENCELRFVPCSILIFCQGFFFGDLKKGANFQKLIIFIPTTLCKSDMDSNIPINDI